MPTKLITQMFDVPHNSLPDQKTIEEMILDEMERQQISFSTLANLTHTDRTHLTRTLKKTGGEKRKLSEALKKRIEEVLDTEFTFSGSQTSDDRPAEDSSKK